MENRVKGGQFVYFIQAGRYVKIGISDNPQKRLATLQSANPERLDLLYVMKGGDVLETMFHSLFDKYNERGEWFRLTGELRKFIDYLVSGKFDIVQNRGVDCPQILTTVEQNIPGTCNALGEAATTEDLVFEILKKHKSHGNVNNMHLKSLCFVLEYYHGIPKSKSVALMDELAENHRVYVSTNNYVGLL